MNSTDPKADYEAAFKTIETCHPDGAKAPVARRKLRAAVEQMTRDAVQAEREACLGLVKEALEGTENGSDERNALVAVALLIKARGAR